MTVKDIYSGLERIKQQINNQRTIYNDCLNSRIISEEARHITMEILEKASNLLDQLMYLVCISIKKNNNENKEKSIRVYFPVSIDEHSLKSTLGRAGLGEIENENIDFYRLVLKYQPFENPNYNWLLTFKKIVGKKHITLLPQKRIEEPRITVFNSNSDSVSWYPNKVYFKAGVSIMRAPVNPYTQNITPTSGLEVKKEIWVSFEIDGYNVDAISFCEKVYEQVKTICDDFIETLELKNDAG